MFYHQTLHGGTETPATNRAALMLARSYCSFFYTSERRRDSPLKKVIAGYLQFYISPGKRLGRFKGHFLAQIRFYFLLKVVLNPLCGEN